MSVLFLWLHHDKRNELIHSIVTIVAAVCRVITDFALLVIIFAQVFGTWRLHRLHIKAHLHSITESILRDGQCSCPKFRILHDTLRLGYISRYSLFPVSNIYV